MPETESPLEGSPTTPGAPRSWWIAAAAVIAHGVFHSLLYGRVISGDAYTYCRYAENFAQGNGLVFNPGERADGYTSFLWVTFLAFAAKLGIGTLAFSKAMGIAFHVGSQASLLVLVREIPFAGRWLALGAPLLLASSSAFASETAAGAETPMFVFLLLATTHMAVRATKTGRGDVVWGGLAALLALARPDGALAFPFFLAWRGLARNRLLEPQLPLVRALLAPAGVFLILAGGAWAARFAYYGQPFPNAFYASPSAEALALAGRGAYRALALLDEHGGFLLAGMASVALVGAGTEPWKGYALFAIAGRLLLQLATGGEGEGHHRLLVPALPFVFLLFVRALDHTRAALSTSLTVRREFVLLTALLGGILLACAACGWRTSLRRIRPESLRRMDFEECASVRMGKWLAENAAADAWILGPGTGALPYWSGRRAIDWNGLTDRFIARTPREAGPDWEVRLVRHLFKERPSYVFVPSADRETCKPGSPVGALVLASAEFREGYVPMSVLAREGETEVWLFTFKRNDLEHADPPGKVERRTGP